MAKMERKKVGKPKLNVGTFHKKLTDMKKKIKQTNQDANKMEQGTYKTTIFSIHDMYYDNIQFSRFFLSLYESKASSVFKAEFPQTARAVRCDQVTKNRIGCRELASSV